VRRGAQEAFAGNLCWHAAECHAFGYCRAAPSDLYHKACAFCRCPFGYGYQKIFKGVVSRDLEVYVDMVCGSCGGQLSLGRPTREGVWEVEYWENPKYSMYQHFAISSVFRNHFSRGKCMSRWLDDGEPMTTVGGVPYALGTGMRHVIRFTSKSPFVTTVRAKVPDNRGGVSYPRLHWAPVCDQGCPVPSLERFRTCSGTQS